MNNPQLGERLKAIRKTKGYSQEALAEESKVSLKPFKELKTLKMIQQEIPFNEYQALLTLHLMNF